MNSKATYQVDASDPNRIRIKVPADVLADAEGRRIAGQLAINRLRAGRR